MFIALAVLGLLAALLTVPIDTSPLPSAATPTTSYAEAAAAYDSLRAGERDLVMRDGNSLMFLHGHRTPRVIVLVHGLTNSPRQFRELGEQFHARGYNVIVPRLPQHGQVPGDVALLQSLTAEKLRAYADRAVDIAIGLGDSIFVMGLSAGGDVAAWMAENRPEVTRVVVIAPAISLAFIPDRLDRPAMNVMDRVPNVTIRQKGDSARPHAYFGVSTRALGETLRFGASVMESAARDAPLVKDVTVVVNDNDHTVDAAPALRLAELWRAHPGVTVRSYHFDRRLLLPHDVIDATQRCGMPDRVYPVLIALMEWQEVVPAPVEDARCAAPRPK